MPMNTRAATARVPCRPSQASARTGTCSVSCRAEVMVRYAASLARVQSTHLSLSPQAFTPHPEVLARSASLEGCRPRRRGLHPSRLAALAPQDEDNRINDIILATRFAPELCQRHSQTFAST